MICYIISRVFYTSCLLVFTNLNIIIIITPIANAKKNVACGEILSQSIQRAYHPGSETIQIAVWKSPNAVHLCSPARSTTNALSVPSTIAKTIPKMIKKAITRTICVTNASPKVTTKNNP